MLLLLLAGPALTVACGGGQETRAIEIEQFPLPDGRIDLVLTVSEDLNVPETTGGKGAVAVLCRDSAGSTVLRSRRRWPFRKDGNPRLPHAHVLTSRSELRSIAMCSITGTSPQLEGRVGLAR